MRKKITNIAMLLFWSCFILAVAGAPASARCVRNNFTAYPDLPMMDWGSAQFWFGRINLASTELQPVGTILGTFTTTAGQASGISDDTVLWTCDIGDKDQLYESFATNGDDRVGGFNETGLADNMPGYYQTWFPNVAIKITHVRSGKVFMRKWQSAQLTDYDVSDDGKKILIKARHLSPVTAEIARVSTSGIRQWYSNWCPAEPVVSGANAAVYICEQPNAYVVFRGPGYEYASDSDGADSASNYRFFGNRNGIAYGMRMASSFSWTTSCVVSNVTPQVYFWPITIEQLQRGEKSEANFTVQLQCDRGVASGTAQNQTAMGIQVSPGAYASAVRLQLTTPTGGVTYLLSDNYGMDPSVATGVGIRLRDADTDQAMNFLGQSGLSGSGFLKGGTRGTGGVPFSFPSGTGAGWYPVFNGSGGAAGGDGTTFVQTRSFTASLERLPGASGAEIMPGRVEATAYVVVKVQ